MSFGSLRKCNRSTQQIKVQVAKENYHNTEVEPNHANRTGINFGCRDRVILMEGDFTEKESVK
jgi:hypothetical protein